MKASERANEPHLAFLVRVASDVDEVRLARIDFVGSGFGANPFVRDEVADMRAFSRYQLDAGDPDIGHELRGAAPQRADEYDYLAANWPELRSFLDQAELEVAPPHAELPAARVVARRL